MKEEDPVEVVSGGTEAAPIEAAQNSTVPSHLLVSTRTMIKSVLTVLGYLLIGACVYMPAEIDQNTGKHWTFIDCVYFGVVTITTVGYGDLYPTTVETKAFTACYGLVGIGMIGIALGKVSRWIVQRHARVVQSHSDAVMQSVQSATKLLADDRHSVQRFRLVSTVRTKTKGACQMVPRCIVKLVPRIVLYYLHNVSALFLSFIPIMMFLPFFGCILGHIEGWSLTDSLYLAVITITSIGYGDFSPKTQGGRLFAATFIPLGVTLIAKALADFIVGLIANKHRSPEVTLAKLADIETRKKGVVTEGEFLTYMLVSLSKVDPKTLQVLRDQFRALDLKCQGGTEEIGQLDVKVLERVLKSPTRGARAVTPTTSSQDIGGDVVAQPGKKPRVRAVI